MTTKRNLNDAAARLRDIADELDERANALETRKLYLLDVKIINPNGSLSKSYTYYHTKDLSAGTVVVLPTTERWQQTPTYGVVIIHSPCSTDNPSWYKAIERVIA